LSSERERGAPAEVAGYTTDKEKMLSWLCSFNTENYVSKTFHVAVIVLELKIDVSGHNEYTI